MKILIADDDELVAKAMQAAFARQGYEVIHAADGEEALQLAAAARPDILVLDVMMPALDGLEVLGRLRENEHTRYLPVIMLSARQHRDDVEAALKLGARDYLVKPYTPEALLGRIKRVLGSKG